MNTVLNRAYRAEFVKVVALSTEPERLTSRSVTSIARDGSTRRCLVTVTGHGFTPGAVVYLAGANEAEFNTSDGVKVARVVNDNTFYVLLSGSTAAATGTLTCYADIWVRQATLIGKQAAQTVNAGDVRIGTKSANGAQPYTIPSDAEAYIPGREGFGPLLNLADFYVDVEINGDGLYVMYH